MQALKRFFLGLLYLLGFLALAIFGILLVVFGKLAIFALIGAGVLALGWCLAVDLSHYRKGKEPRPPP